ncbi:MAG: hypothetical protein JXR03_01430 [Cyclobacteriaceae bacterium]
MYELLNNWKVVLLSLAGATTFWFFNALNKDYNAVINYPVEFQFAKDSVVVMEPLPDQVTIDVSSGGWNLIKNILFFNVKPIQIDLENPTEISYFTRSSIFPLITDQLSELEVNYMITDTLYINIEKKKTRKIRLRVDSIRVSLEPGYRLTSAIKIEPDSIEIIGPESFLDSLGSTYAILPDEREIDDPFDKIVEVSVPDAALVSAIPENVNIKFDVEEFEQIEMLLEVEAVNFPNDSSVFLAQQEVNVVFTIASSKMEDFKPSDFAITADLAMLNKKDSSVLAMLIYYPEHAIEVEVQPEHVRVEYGE